MGRRSQEQDSTNGGKSKFLLEKSLIEGNKEVGDKDATLCWGRVQGKKKIRRGESGTNSHLILSCKGGGRGRREHGCLWESAGRNLALQPRGKQSWGREKKSNRCLPGSEQRS